MEDDKLLQRFQSPDGKRWFELRQHQTACSIFRNSPNPPTPFRSTAPSPTPRPVFDPASTPAPKQPKLTCARWFPGLVEFQNKTPAARRRECAATEGLRSVADKSAKTPTTNNKHVTGLL